MRAPGRAPSKDKGRPLEPLSRTRLPRSLTRGSSACVCMIAWACGLDTELSLHQALAAKGFVAPRAPARRLTVPPTPVHWAAARGTAMLPTTGPMVWVAP